MKKVSALAPSTYLPQHGRPKTEPQNEKFFRTCPSLTYRTLLPKKRNSKSEKWQKNYRYLPAVDFRINLRVDIMMKANGISEHNRINR